MPPLLLAFVGGLALGMVPAAWILVRLHSRKDVGASGSGNVGALNAMRVSRSKALGIAVVALDAAKGALAAWLAPTAGDAPVLHLQFAATLGVVAGHDYNLVLSALRRRLSGGKGFAAAGGALGVCAPWLVLVWIGVLVVAYVLLRKTRGMRDEAPASAVATVAMVPAGAWLLGTPGLVLGLGLVALVGPKLAREVASLLRSPPEPVDAR